jgi:hypothetical protein
MIDKKSDTQNSLKIKPIINDADNDNLNNFIEEKILYIQGIIRNTISSIKKNKEYDIFSNSDTNLSISVLTELYEKTNDVSKQARTNNSKNVEKLIDLLQKIIDKLSMIICGFGTKYIDDLLFIIFGTEFKNIRIESPILNAKYDIIKNYIQPIGYKVLHWKPNKLINTINNINCSNKITEDKIIIEDSNAFECFDVDTSSKSFYQKIYGIKVVIQNEKNKKTLIINGIIDDIHINCFTNLYIKTRINEIKEIAEEQEELEKEILLRIIDTITLKDILIFGNYDIHKKMISVFTETNLVKQTKIENTIKKFLELDVYSQRNMLINLLIYNKDNEIQYICYLLYDLITANTVDSNNSSDQNFIYESLPWKIKMYFKDVVKYTIKCTNDMMQKYDVNKISLEQQIYLLKANESVKEKAMAKLKEIKGKPDELSTKAKQYLEGLIKIPFGIYREEPILKKIKEINKWFIRTLTLIEQLFPEFKITKKEKYSTIEIVNLINDMNTYINEKVYVNLETIIEKNSNKQLSNVIQYINAIKKSKGEKKYSLTNVSKNNNSNRIIEYIKNNKSDELLTTELYDQLNISSPLSLSKTKSEFSAINTNISNIETAMKNIIDVLDDSIYGHSHAKNQLLKIIAQWMNGEQTGYCFGFEGSPGIGKTSLAKKGLSNCLKDEKGESRPFSFIALGGSSSGTSLEGYGYTYVHSTWGKIVDILMEAKCMNPIIYVDELDKVSKTENGKEIIGIFTHLIDSTQNDCFQDKYFSGIEIDLSKALFIFSYNDPDQIDRILLDRIHRIKFENLSLDEKMVIVRKYILPEINKKMGFENVVELSDEIIEYIIDSYTIEPGVRKLKELLFDLFGEINLNILQSSHNNVFELPIVITKDNLEDKYLIKYNKINEKHIHKNHEIGIINGLWANSLGRGGIIPIQTLFYPSSTFLDLRLTGLQGDVMKESMNVAKTLAWNLTNNVIKKEWLKQFEETKCQGLHIHCPEGSISKDGPSAGAAITVAIFSLLNKKFIQNDMAITGEISLNGEITAIGGLDIKILGGIKSGITTFIYPKANNKEYNEWKKKYKKDKHDNIQFIEVSTIKEVFEHVFIEI